MTAPAIVWTTEPFPATAQTARVAPACRTCRQSTLSRSSEAAWFTSPHTRSAEPVAEGCYLVQAHTDWCPAFTGVAPELPCPVCGAPIVDYEMQRGFSLTVPDAGLGVAHLVGTADEIFSHPAARLAGVLAHPEPAPAMDKLRAEPCQHILEGGDAHRILALAAQLRRTKRLAAILDRDRSLLEAAEAAGQHTLAEAYRTAVRACNGDVSGLRLALTALHPHAATTTPEGGS